MHILTGNKIIILFITLTIGLLPTILSTIGTKLARDIIIITEKGVENPAESSIVMDATHTQAKIPIPESMTTAFPTETL